MSFRSSLFLAFRYLRPRINLTTVSTFLAILGPVIGVAVLVVVASVMNGFHARIQESFFGFTSHIVISNYNPQKPIPNLDRVMKVLAEQGYPGVSAAIQTPSLIQMRGQLIYHQFLGIDPQTDRQVTQFFRHCRFDYGGRSYNFQERYLNLQDGEIICGLNFLIEHGLRIGDRIVVHPLARLQKMIKYEKDGSISLSQEEGTYIPIELRIVGTFHFGMAQLDSMVSLISRDQAAELAGLEWGDATLIKVMTRDPFAYDKEIRRLYGINALDGLSIRSWRDQNETLFQALQTEKAVMLILLVLIVVVSAFCVCATLITIVSQKLHEIGILKAIGADPFSIMNVFLVQGGIIGGLGIVLGTLTGLGLLMIRNDFLNFCRRHFNEGLLPESLYFFKNLPAKVEITDLVLINASTFTLCLLAGILPA
ncbi:MAG: ABC transporter permease, partial [Lentisphaerae bacterium]